jgi:hypothetical protein
MKRVVHHVTMICGRLIGVSRILSTLQEHGKQCQTFHICLLSKNIEFGHRFRMSSKTRAFLGMVLLERIIIT